MRLLFMQCPNFAKKTLKKSEFPPLVSFPFSSKISKIKTSQLIFIKHFNILRIKWASRKCNHNMMRRCAFHFIDNRAIGIYQIFPHNNHLLLVLVSLKFLVKWFDAYEWVHSKNHVSDKDRGETKFRREEHIAETKNEEKNRHRVVKYEEVFDRRWFALIFY